jgi:uncharacterized protein (TIGR00303 family)
MRDPILFAHAAVRGTRLAENWRGERPAFWCVLAHTDTSARRGLSAAGVTHETLPMTPAADAEVVLLGAPRCLPALPSNPLGAAGPSGITRAALGLAGVEPRFLGIGLRVWPATEFRRLVAPPGADIASGQAVPTAAQLFESGVQYGGEIARGAPYVVIAESVPAGTTTALALLLALGIHAEGRVSGSQADNAHRLKTRVARAALASAGLEVGDGRADPLGAVRALGDPMQPVVAGMAVGASGAGRDVLLGGGSQMLAVAALIHALAGAAGLERILVGTTRWVIDDPAADVAGLADEISPDLPVAGVNLDFSASRHAALRAYERGLVKEGVGAGAAAMVALLRGSDLCTLHAAIDATYDSLLEPSRTLE